MLVYIYIPTDAYTAIHYAAQELVTQCMSMHFIIITSCARPQGGSQDTTRGGFAAHGRDTRTRAQDRGHVPRLIV